MSTIHRTTNSSSIRETLFDAATNSRGSPCITRTNNTATITFFFRKTVDHWLCRCWCPYCVFIVKLTFLLICWHILVSLSQYGICIFFSQLTYRLHVDYSWGVLDWCVIDDAVFRAVRGTSNSCDGVNVVDGENWDDTGEAEGDDDDDVDVIVVTAWELCADRLLIRAFVFVFVWET